MTPNDREDLLEVLTAGVKTIAILALATYGIVRIVLWAFHHIYVY